MKGIVFTIEREERLVIIDIVDRAEVRLVIAMQTWKRGGVGV